MAVGCRHCVCCNYLALQHPAARRGSAGCSSEPLELWPAGLQSPTVYYMIRERQLAYQMHMAARSDRPADLWRPASVSDGRSNALLQRRGRPILAVRVPQGTTGVDATDSRAVYVRSVPLKCSSAPAKAPPAVAVAAAPVAGATAAPAKPASRVPPLHHSITPPRLEESRIKRLRPSRTPPTCPGRAVPVPVAASAVHSLWTAAAAAPPGHLIAPHPHPHSSEPVVLAMPVLASSSNMAAVGTGFCPQSAPHPAASSPLMARLSKLLFGGKPQRSPAITLLV